MKILFVLEYYHPHIGGVETLFKSLVDQLISSGHHVTIITQRFIKELPRVERIGTCTIRRYTFFNRYFFTILAFFPAMRYAFSHDIIHTTSYNAGFPAIFAGMYSRKKVIITFHEFWGRLWYELPFMGKFQKWLHFIFERLLIKLPFTKFVADSDNSKKALEQAGVRAAKIDRIYCGLDYDQFPNNRIEKNNDIFQFIYFGRLGISKGLDILLEGAKRLSKEDYKFHLHIVVPRDPRDFLNYIKSYVHEHALHTVITFHHELPRNELHQRILQSDCVVIPSYSEGFGFVAAESVAMEMPIISSHRGSLSEVVCGNHIVMTKFSGEGLKQAMVKAIQNKWQYSDIIKFPLADFAKNYVDLYQKIIK